MYRKIKNKTNSKRKYWVHPMLRQKHEFANFYFELRQHEEKFVLYFRMKITTFDKLLAAIENKIKHESNKMRESIPPYMRLAVTLR